MKANQPIAMPRAQCAEGPRPCPHTECRYHLGTAAESCALDVADQGEHTQEEVGALLGVTHQYVWQIERKALAKLASGPYRHTLRSLLHG